MKANESIDDFVPERPNAGFYEMVRPYIKNWTAYLELFASGVAFAVGVVGPAYAQKEKIECRHSMTTDGRWVERYYTTVYVGGKKELVSAKKPILLEDMPSADDIRNYVCQKDPNQKRNVKK